MVEKDKYPIGETCLIEIGDIEKNTGQIKDLPDNPREWTQEDIDRISKSIEQTPELLDARPLLLIWHNGVLVCLGGNLRLEGCNALGWEKAPGYIFPDDTPVQKLKEIVIKDNGAFGSWDEKKLQDNWADCPLFDWGIKEFAKPEETEDREPPAEEDDFDERVDKVETICKEGDLWKLGNHRLYCGDSTDNEDVKYLMGGGVADLWITDPPYNVDVENSDGKKIKNDNMSDMAFREFLYKAFSAAETAIKPGAACYIWMASTEIDACIEAFEKAGLLYKQMLIWVKNQFTLGRQDYQWRHENCIYGWKPGASHYFTDSRRESTVQEDKPDIEKMSKAEAKALLKKIFDDEMMSTTVLRYNKPAYDDEHPTMKPVPMIGYQIQNSSKRGEIVLDTFGGSGTTAIACEQLGRRCYLMELDPHYCDVIIARWEKLTGLKAEKIS